MRTKLEIFRDGKVSCLARIAPESVDVLTGALRAIDCIGPVVIDRLSVSAIGKLSPNVLLLDVDDLDVDPLEMLRMLRFVLPASIIGAYTNVLEDGWALACHTAGTNCVFSKASGQPAIEAGLRQALRIGCFTDPSFEGKSPN